MKLCTYVRESGPRLALETHVGWIDVAVAADALGHLVPRTAEELYHRGSDALEPLAVFSRQVSDPDPIWRIDIENETLGPAVPSPQKILCVGLNYARHAAESGMDEPETPVLFSKFANTIAASGEDVPLPPEAQEYDYEAELVVVIGRRARRVPESEALSYVMGYCNGNDLSARDLQRRTGQWLLGKTLDKFMPLGPYLVTADELSEPQDLRVRCWLNGELRQDSSTADMIFGVAEVVSYASRYMTLEPGDVISTGTPEGVILGRAEKVWLAPGDEVTVEIGNLGRLQNRMVDGARSQDGRSPGG